MFLWGRRPFFGDLLARRELLGDPSRLHSPHWRLRRLQVVLGRSLSCGSEGLLASLKRAAFVFFLGLVSLTNLLIGVPLPFNDLPSSVLEREALNRSALVAHLLYIRLPLVVPHKRLRRRSDSFLKELEFLLERLFEAFVICGANLAL